MDGGGSSVEFKYPGPGLLQTWQMRRLGEEGGYGEEEGLRNGGATVPDPSAVRLVSRV